MYCLSVERYIYYLVVNSSLRLNDEVVQTGGSKILTKFEFSRGFLGYPFLDSAFFFGTSIKIMGLL